MADLSDKAALEELTFDELVAAAFSLPDLDVPPVYLENKVFKSKLIDKIVAHGKKKSNKKRGKKGRKKRARKKKTGGSAADQKFLQGLRDPQHLKDPLLRVTTPPTPPLFSPKYESSSEALSQVIGPIEVNFKERPFGFSLIKNKTGDPVFVVKNVNNPKLDALGLEPGWILVSVGENVMKESDYTMNSLFALLTKSTLPCKIIFRPDVPSRPNTPTGERDSYSMSSMAPSSYGQSNLLPMPSFGAPGKAPIKPAASELPSAAAVRPPVPSASFMDCKRPRPVEVQVVTDEDRGSIRETDRRSLRETMKSLPPHFGGLQPEKARENSISDYSSRESSLPPEQPGEMPRMGSTKGREKTAIAIEIEKRIRQASGKIESESEEGGDASKDGLVFPKPSAIEGALGGKRRKKPKKKKKPGKGTRAKSTPVKANFSSNFGPRRGKKKKKPPKKNWRKPSPSPPPGRRVPPTSPPRVKSTGNNLETPDQAIEPMDLAQVAILTTNSGKPSRLRPPPPMPRKAETPPAPKPDLDAKEEEEYDGEMINLSFKAVQKPLEAWSKECKKRVPIIKEIISSEKTYIKGLTTLCKSFFDPIFPKYLSESLKPELTMQAHTILNFHTFLLTQLETSDNLPEVLIKNADFLKMYTAYVDNYDKVTKKILSLRRSKSKFAKFLDKTGAELNSNFFNYSIMPIQRVPRYELFLRDLLKRTQEDHPQYKSLTAALEKIKKISQHINESKRQIENMNELMQLTSQLDKGEAKSFWTATRKLLRKGEMVNGNNFQKVKVFLFNDNLLVCDTQSIKFRREFPLSQMLSVASCTTTHNEEKLFGVEMTIEGLDGSLRLFCSSEKEGESWREQLESLRPKQELFDEAPTRGGRTRLISHF